MHFILAEIGCTRDHAADVAHARYLEKKAAEAGLLDEDDGWSRLDELLALAEVGLSEAGLEAKDDDTSRLDEDDDWSRLHELLALAETGLAEPGLEDEEDWKFLSQCADEVEVAYLKQKAEQANAAETSHRDDVVVEDCGSDDSLLTDYVSMSHVRFSL